MRGFRLLRLPVAAGSPISRGLLVKRHVPRDAEEKEAADRTLFVTHVDGFITEAQMLRCFTTGFGPVEKVEIKSVEKKAPRLEQRLDSVQTYVNFARVVFTEAATLQKALDAATGRLVGNTVLPLPSGQLKERLRAQKEMYQDPAQLRQEVDAWMANYDEREEEKRRLAREAAAVDDDGFVKVVSGTTRTPDGVTMRAAKRPGVKTGAFSEPIKGAPAATIDDEGLRKKRSKEMPDFYKFQLREKRRQEIIDHRKRTAKDMETVERMRKKKKFKTSKTE